MDTSLSKFNKGAVSAYEKIGTFSYRDIANWIVQLRAAYRNTIDWKRK